MPCTISHEEMQQVYSFNWRPQIAWVPEPTWGFNLDSRAKHGEINGIARYGA